MTLRNHLELFYTNYNIPPNGGIEDAVFEVPLPYFTLTLPNFSWRKKMLYIHDLEHILNKQDTSWQGEIFIASWEISTGFFRNFPVLIFPLWTMGWGLWVNRKTVYKAFKKGHSDKGIARLQLSQDELLEMNLIDLQGLTLLKRHNRNNTLLYLKFTFWSLISQLVFLFPVLILSVLLFLLIQ